MEIALFSLIKLKEISNAPKITPPYTSGIGHAALK